MELIDIPELNLNTKVKIIAFGAVCVIVLMTISSSFYTINGTERGVLLDWGKPQLESLEPGWGVKIPYQQQIDIYNIQTQKYSAMAQSASKDLQDVATEVTVNYRLDGAKVPYIYINLGHSYEEKVIAPTVQEVVKQVTAEFTAADLIQQRPKVKTGVEAGIRSRLAPYNILIDSGGVSLTGFEYSEGFSNAIEAKVTAVQLKDKAANDLERVKIEAQQKIAQAAADQKYATPDMLALKQIEVNKMAIEKWNGILPQIIMGEGSPGLMPMLNLNKVGSA